MIRFLLTLPRLRASTTSCAVRGRYSRVPSRYAATGRGWKTQYYSPILHVPASSCSRSRETNLIHIRPHGNSSSSRCLTTYGRSSGRWSRGLRKPHADRHSSATSIKPGFEPPTGPALTFPSGPWQEALHSAAGGGHWATILANSEMESSWDPALQAV